MARLFQASSSGVGSGLIISCDGAYAMTVIVVPKMWFQGQRHHVVTWPRGGRSLELCIAELDTVELSGTEEQLAALDRYFDRRRDEAGPGLLTPIGRQAIAKVAHTDGGVLPPDEAVRSLDALCGVTGLGSLVGQLTDAWSVASRVALLRPLLVREFVQEVTARIREARRGYVWKEETLSALRGRVDPTSVVTSRATGWARLTCRYEDFNRETDLLRIIVSALMAVAAEPAPGQLWRSLWASAREEAISLRRQLEDVRDLPRAQAVRTAARVRLGTFDRGWRTALSLASLVLEPDAGVTTDSSGSGTTELVIDTSRAWECILRDVLQRAKVSELVDLNRGDESPLSVARPWSQMSVAERPPRPDLLFRTDDGWWVVDAKYKRLNGGNPSTDDQYQVFAYSHLAQPLIARLGLVYPQAERGSLSRGPYARSIQADCSLWVQQLQFPTHQEVVVGWRNYLDQSAMLISSGLLVGST